ncbi:D-alanyl-D-alanine dipeptidase [compost metagenome]
MDVISHHEAEGITPAEAENRRLLRSIMESSGFHSYAYEWWHYTLKNEPYPGTYFDFPIG